MLGNYFIFLVVMLVSMYVLSIFENRKYNPTSEEFEELKKYNLVPDNCIDFKSLNRKQKKEVRKNVREMRISYAFVQKCKKAQKQEN